MAKMALCVKRSDLQKVYEQQHLYLPARGIGHFNALLTRTHEDNNQPDHLNDIFNIPVVLLDRADCETDPTYLQLLPYMVVTDASTGKVLVYKRGPKGEENRLHGALSIGIGGHVDTAPEQSDTVLDHLVIEACRELNEEIGIDITEGIRVHVKSQLKYANLLITNKNEVSDVHLGLAFRVFIDKDTELSNEEDIVMDHQWLTKEEISTLINQPGNSLELWSDMLVDSMYNQQF